MPKNRIISAITIAVILAGSLQTLGQPNQPAPGALGGPPAAVGEAAAKPAPAPPTEAELLLDQAIAKLKALESVSAEIHQKVEMLDQKFQVKGRYLKAPKDRLFLKLEVVDLPDASGFMQQVCDGTTFWEHQQVFETQIYRRLDAGPILSKMRESDLDADFRDAINTQLGFAGPDALLVGLRKNVTFDQKTEGTLNDQPVWIVRGTWTNREGLFAPNGQPLPPTMQIPSFVPSLISVYLGKDDLWPYKVMLAGQNASGVLNDTRPAGPDGKRIGPLRSRQQPLVTRIELIYSNVKLNAAIPDQEFAFTPPKDARVEDHTKDILAALDQAATMRAAQKKAEAAKGEDPLLNQSIDVPKAISEPGTPPAAAPPQGAGEPAAPKK